MSLFITETADSDGDDVETEYLHFKYSVMKQMSDMKEPKENVLRCGWYGVT